MKNFSELGIKPKENKFIGDKIKIDRILDNDIVVNDFEIEPSKFEGNRLKLAIEYKEEKRIVFTGSANLMDMIGRVDKKHLPISTKIVKKEDRFEFT
jgi:hypothetical protein